MKKVLPFLHISTLNIFIKKIFIWFNEKTIVTMQTQQPKCCPTKLQG